MTFSIAQDFSYAGNDYWKWWAWIEGDDCELDDVHCVVWLLHPSFRNPEVAIRDRTSKFRIETSGWGTFQLRARVELAGGMTIKLRKQLRLEYPRDESKSVVGKEVNSSLPSVFLSYSRADARSAAQLRDALQHVGVIVLDESDIRPGESWLGGLEQRLTKADVVIGVVNEEPSPLVIADGRAASAAQKPFIPVHMGGRPSEGDALAEITWDGSSASTDHLLAQLVASSNKVF